MVFKLIMRNSNLWSEVYYAWCMRCRHYIGSEFWLNRHSRKVSQAVRHRFCGHICFVSGDTQARQTKMHNKHWQQALRVCVSLRRNTVSCFLFVCLREVTGNSVKRDTYQQWQEVGCGSGPEEGLKGMDCVRWWQLDGKGKAVLKS